MPSDLTILVADVTRMAAIRAGLLLTGRVVQFTNFNLSTALAAIQTDEPCVVAIDALLVQTQQGLGFIKRVESLAKAGFAIRLVVRGNRAWTTTEHDVRPSTDETPIARASVPPSRPAAVAAAKTGTNTRRAPRFPMLDALNAAVEGGQASLVNISVLGAQVMSQPVLRPGQTVKIALPDNNQMLHLTAHVAWSMFQQTKQGTVAYRAGVAFTDAAQETLDDYCRRYGGQTALPSF
jgi:PilZ domain-containing protein